MSNKKATADNFDKAVESVLEAFSDEAQQATQEAVNETATGALRAVRTAAKSHGWSGGEYYKSLAAYKAKKAGYNISAYIYNKDPGYRLAHLLEHGHISPAKRMTKAYPHYEAGQQYIDDYFMELTRRYLEK